MMLVGSLRIIHERLMMRDIVASVYDRIVSGETRMMLATNGATLGVHACGREATLEPAPGDALGIQQITDVFTGHCNLVHTLEFWIRCHAIIEQWPRIADHSSGCRRVGNVARRAGEAAVRPLWRQCCRESISRHQIERSGSGRPKRGAPGIVVHSEVLRVIPHCGNRVAVVVAHYQSLAKAIV